MTTVIASFRRLTPGVLASQRLAGEVLDEDIEKSELAMTLKKAVPVLKIGGTAYQILDILLGLVRAKDLRAGRRPLVAISNEKLAQYTDRSVRTVSRCLKRLVEVGVLAYADSPNGRRFVRRDQSGAVDYGYGLDLTPACKRLEELQAMIAVFQEQIQREKQARRKVIARARAIKDLALMLGKAGALVLRKAEEILEQPLDPLSRAEALETIYLETLELEANLSCMGDKNGVSISNTTPENTQNFVDTERHGSTEPSSKSCSDNEAFSSVEIALENEYGAKALQSQARNQPQPLFIDRQSPLPSSHLSGISIGLLSQATSEVGELLQVSLSTWSDLFRITDDLRHLIGLSQAGWNTACAAQGQHLAASCLLVVAEKALRSPQDISRPGGYFRAMVDRANEGKLNLQKSVFGLVNGI